MLLALLRSLALSRTLARSLAAILRGRASLPGEGDGDGDGDGGGDGGGEGLGGGGVGETQEGLHMMPVHVSIVKEGCVTLTPSHLISSSLKLWGLCAQGAELKTVRLSARRCTTLRGVLWRRGGGGKIGGGGGRIGGGADLKFWMSGAPMVKSSWRKHAGANTP